MRKIREVLRLKFNLKTGNRDIATSCNISASTVSEMLVRFNASGIAWPMPEGLSDPDLEARLYPQPEATGERYIPEWSYIHQEMGKKHVTLMLLWDEYYRQHPDGFTYSWFCEQYGKWRKMLCRLCR